jgi:hypothetical protein
MVLLNVVDGFAADTIRKLKKLRARGTEREVITAV